MELTKIMAGEEKRRLAGCVVLVFLLGMLAHGYVFFQDSFSHDSLNAFYADGEENAWMISLGRFMVPAYRAVFRGDMALPWLIGVLTMVWLGLAVYLVGRLFRLRSWLSLGLTAAVFITNRTVTAWAATYIFLMDIVCLGILLATAAAVLWREHPRGMLLGVPLVALSLGLYQSNISVVITLLMLVSILELVDGADVKQVLLRGISGIGMILGGGVVYAVCNKLVQLATGVEASQTGNSLSMMTEAGISLFERIKAPYFQTKVALLQPVSNWPLGVTEAATVLLALAAVVLVIGALRRNRVGLCALALCGVLTVLLPVGMEVSAALAGRSHDLMHFAVWFLFLFVVVLLERYLPEWKGGREKLFARISVALLLCVLWNNVVVANTLYVKKDLEQEGAVSVMTRVVDRMEQTEGYEPGVTPVAFIGKRGAWTAMEGFEDYIPITGAGNSSPITGINGNNFFNTYDAFFTYVLNEPVRFCEEALRQSLMEDPQVIDMPVFPAEGSVELLDGVMVVKMGNNK